MNTAPKLVLLDVGMVAELTPEDQHNLVGFFKVSLLPSIFSCFWPAGVDSFTVPDILVISCSL